MSVFIELQGHETSRRTTRVNGRFGGESRRYRDHEGAERIANITSRDAARLMVAELARVGESCGFTPEPERCAVTGERPVPGALVTVEEASVRLSLRYDGNGRIISAHVG